MVDTHKNTKDNDLPVAPDLHERIQNLRLMDDVLMNVFFNENIPATELVIRTIIGKKDLMVKEVQVQKIFESVGRSVQLDIFAKDSKGTLYDIEIQRDSRGASPRRVRYHSALMDVTAINRGAEFDELPEKYIIFITENDYFKRGLPVYSFANTLLDDKLKIILDDGQHYIYVNGANTDNTPLGYLMRDFREKDPAKMHYEVLREKMEYFKGNKKGEKIMGNVIEELRAEGRVEGRAEGRTEGRVEGRAEGRTESINALAKYLKKFSAKAEAIKQLKGAFGLSDDEATSIYMAA